MIETSYSEIDISEASVAEYARDGAVLLERPFAPAWVDGLADAYRDMLAQDATGHFKGDVYRQDGRFEVSGGVGFHPFVRKWALESTAAEIVARVIGSASARLYTGYDVCFGKQEEAGDVGDARQAATSFHIDGSAWGFGREQVPSFWIALTDVGEDFGPLIAAAGSHRDMDRLILSSPIDPEAPVAEGYLPYSAMQDFLDRGRYPMKIFPARKGDVVVINPLVVHGSLPMRKAGLRMALSTRWLGDGARWQGQSDAAGAALADGTPDPVRYPLVWSRETGPVGAAAEAVHTLTDPVKPMRYIEYARVETQDFVA